MGKRTFIFFEIGVVHNDFDRPVQGDLIRRERSQLIIDPQYEKGLFGLSPGQDLLVVFLFHRAPEGDIALKQHPRGDKDRPPRGVFALRSPHRPNPIGVTKVVIESIEDNTLVVRGLDALNGSPILDLKIAGDGSGQE